MEMLLLELSVQEDEMAGWHHWLDGREFEWTPGVGDGQGHNWATELNWTEVKSLTPL